MPAATVCHRLLATRERERQSEAMVRIMNGTSTWPPPEGTHEQCVRRTDGVSRRASPGRKRGQPATRAAHPVPVVVWRRAKRWPAGGRGPGHGAMKSSCPEGRSGLAGRRHHRRPRRSAGRAPWGRGTGARGEALRRDRRGLRIRPAVVRGRTGTEQSEADEDWSEDVGFAPSREDTGEQRPPFSGLGRGSAVPAERRGGPQE